MEIKSVVVACAVIEQCFRAHFMFLESCGVVCCTPQALSLFLESCGVVCCSPQALSLFLESWGSVLCQGITLPFSTMAMLQNTSLGQPLNSVIAIGKV